MGFFGIVFQDVIENRDFCLVKCLRDMFSYAKHCAKWMVAMKDELIRFR